MTERPPLDGVRVGVTAARKAEEQAALLERRGATVVHGPALSLDSPVDDDVLRAATDAVLAGPVDVLVATTGIGLRQWFGAVERWGLTERLLAHLGDAEVLARGPKSVGALRRHGLREDWSAGSEELDEVLDHLRGRDLTGRRVVLQEHGQALPGVAATLERQGAEVVVVAVYRVGAASDPEPLLDLVDQLADGDLDAVTFTSAPAVHFLMTVARSVGRGEEVVDAFRGGVVAACVGPVTAQALTSWDVEAIHPERFRLGAMVTQLEDELVRRRVRRP